MSSILDALKKAERESTEGRSADLPLPAPLPKRSPYPMVRRRWWLPLGAVGLLFIGMALFWQFQRSDPSGPAVVSPPPIPDAQTSSPPPIRQAERPEPLPAPRKKASAVVQAPAVETAPAPGAESPAVTAVPVHPPQQTVRKSPPPMVAKAPPARPPETRSQPQPSAHAPKSESANAVPSRVLPRKIDQPSPPPAASLEKSDKTYRSDPRIELQALVWSPDAAERFVIVNDRLIKEGGSIEGIKVVRINPDDVLVSEDSKRWHEPFKIR